jgi:DNA-binding transcriptional LysR family regulator
MVLTLEGLESFLVLTEELHFTRAAARLHVAQPALTKRIQQLEDTLGVRLFVRTRRAVRLTADGQALAAHAADVLRATGHLTRAAARLRTGEAGHLRIGFTPSAPHHVLPALLRAFRAAHPDASCALDELGSDAQVRRLRDGDLDIGILRPPGDAAPEIVCTTFLEEPFVAVLPAGHPLARRRTLPLASLADERFVLISRKVVGTIPDQVLAACAQAGVAPRDLQEASHLHAVVALVAAGSGVSVLPASAVDAGTEGVVTRPFRPATLRTVMAVARRRHDAPALARAFERTATRVFSAGR